MRKRQLVFPLATLGLSIVLLAALEVQGIAAAISSGHDFRNDIDGEPGNCSVCHMRGTSVDASRANTPLWLAQSGPQNYTDMRTVPMRDSESVSVSGVSNSCLSCHDGSVAGESSERLSADTTMPGWDARAIASSVGNSHPVSLVYDGASARLNPGLFDPSVAPSGLGGTIAQDLLVDSRVECSSCHTVHDKHGDGSFLRISNKRGELCLTCHDL